MGFEIIETLATLSDSRRALTRLFRIKYPTGNTALLLTKETDTDEGTKKSSIVLSEAAAGSLYMALENYFM